MGFSPLRYSASWPLLRLSPLSRPAGNIFKQSQQKQDAWNSHNLKFLSISPPILFQTFSRNKTE